MTEKQLHSAFDQLVPSAALQERAKQRVQQAIARKKPPKRSMMAMAAGIMLVVCVAAGSRIFRVGSEAPDTGIDMAAVQEVMPAEGDTTEKPAIADRIPTTGADQGGDAAMIGESLAGEITALDGDQMTVTAEDGTALTLTLPPVWQEVLQQEEVGLLDATQVWYDPETGEVLDVTRLS